MALAEWIFRDKAENDYIQTGFGGYQLPINVARFMTQKMLAMEGERYVPEKNILLHILNENDTCIEVGANIGYDLLLIHGAVGPGGKIICIEPETRNVFDLKKCIEVNHFENVEILESAVGEEAGHLQLKSRMNAEICASGQGDTTVPVITLNSLIDRSPHCVIIDIEGYEVHALLGGRDLIEKCHPKLFIKVHPHRIPKYGYSVRIMIDLLKKHYSHIKFLEKKTPKNILKKMQARYSWAHLVKEIDSEESLLKEFEECSRTSTFWIYCKNT